MAEVGELTLKVGVDMETAVCEMFDIAESLDELMELVPEWNKYDAAKIKTSILDKMVSWIGSDGKNETKV